MRATGATGTQAARRGPERRTAIFESVFELLAEVGYDRMTMDAVAARAHVSKATIYRTWPDKPELVAESIGHHFGATPAPSDTGSLRGDLIAQMEAACHSCNSVEGQVIAGVMTASARNQVLADTMREYMYENKRGIHEEIVRRAVERGEVASTTDPDLLHEVMHSMVIIRRLEAAELDEKYLLHVVDDVLIPVLTYHR